MYTLIKIRRNILLKIAVFLVHIFSSLFLSAQQYSFENFTLENGLPQATIYCIFQDSRGYLWLGTEGSGVCRFDGKRFQSFDQSKGLAGQVVRTILEDSKGHLWFGTEAGISVYDGISFLTINEQKGLSSNTVVCLFKDKSGAIWAGTAGDNGGLNKIESENPDSFKIKTYTVDNGLTSNSVFSICEDNFNRLWIGTFGGGISIKTHDEKAKSFEFTPFNDFPSSHILTMSLDSANRLWVGTYDKGIVRITVSKDINASKSEVLGSDAKVSDNAIWSILPTSKEIWAGTNEIGILKFFNENWTSINSSNGILKNQIIFLYKDREANIWISASDGGISRFLGNKFYHLTKKDGLSDDNVYSIAVGKNGETWIGTYGGGLFRLTQRNGIYSFKNYTVKDGLPDNVINSLDLDLKGSLWIATPKGVAKFNGDFFKVFTEEKDGLINNEVNRILIDKNGIVWCGTRKGISIYDGIGFKNTKENYLPNLEVQTIIQDKSSNIWCGTLGGLIKFHGDKITTFDEVEGLMHKKIHCLAEDRAGNIWIGTFGGGIYKLTVNTYVNRPIMQMITDSLLNSSNIYSLIFENDSTLIAGTDKGLNRIILNSNAEVVQVYRYGLKDGFSGVKTNLNAITKKGNEIWIGTVNGITSYIPEFDNLNNSRPKIQIEDIKLFFNDVDWAKENYSILPWSKLPQNLKLSYSSNHLTFHFVGLLYSDKEELSYRYMLEGLEKSWSPPRKEDEAVYPGLPPGEYTFKVIALDRYGNSSNEAATFPFIITPPFWRTTWFYLLCSFFVTLSIVAFIKYRERKLRSERDTLERIVEERTSEVVHQKGLIENQRDEIQKQHEIVSEQKKEIIDSILCAKKIQNAAIPSEEIVRNELKDLFIFYRPRDVVSGDFYWLGIEDEKIIVIAADCTGHGVPGALTSMLGISMLNDIIGQGSATSPDVILNELRNNLIRSLKQSSESETKDGMDIVVLSINKIKNELEFAGAFNPLFVIRDSSSDTLSDDYMEEGDFRLHEIKGDKMPAAFYLKMEPFKKTTIKIKSDDKFYIFSDGFEDQFGGPDHRKFMKKNLKKLLLQIHYLPMSEQNIILEKTLNDWMGDLSQIDDILLIGFSI
jgi:ligand-binding sensor domain-containing protein/serine phosphatase RsbU (regulator of sigma subunit)